MKLIGAIALFALVSAVFAQDTPACRATFIDEETGEELLVPREGGATGCISDAECIQHTAANSWCKSDGTCHQCDETTGLGCCDLGNDAPPALFPCTFWEHDADWGCAIDTMCGNSYCREDNTCRPCDPTDDAPGSKLTILTIGPRSVGAALDLMNQVCKAFEGCEAAHITDLDLSLIEEQEDGSYDSTQGQICFDACDGEGTGYDLVFPVECKLDGSDDLDCPAETGCPDSFCKPSGESVLGFGMCHRCDAVPVVPSPPTCSGLTETEHEQCRIDTGCSASYCKGAVCQECPSDGYTGAAE